MLTVGFAGAYVQLLMSPAVLSTACSPPSSALAMLADDQANRDVERVAPPRKNV